MHTETRYLRCMHIFRWDIDKTYLETSFSSFRGLLKTAIETADQKKNVAGSAALLRSLISSNPGCKVTVISGSPTQLRTRTRGKIRHRWCGY